MSNKTSNQQNGQPGFTILEVLIAFSVGGLILMITFMAIPTLQRNSRNNLRKQDVANVLQTISRWELNHSGSVPGTTDTYLTNAHLSIYDPANVTIIPTVDAASAPTPVGPISNTEIVQIYKYQKCDSAVFGGSKRDGAGYHDVVALFAVETHNGTLGMCQEI